MIFDHWRELPRGKSFRSVFFLYGLCVITRGWLLAQPDSDTRNPIPSFAKQTEATKLLEETQGIRGLDTVAKKKAALKKLMELARSGGLATEELYVVLTKSIPLAKDAADVPVLIEALRLLTERFSVDGIKEKTTAWTGCMESCSSKTLFKPIWDATVEVVRQGTLENRFSEATSLLKAAEATAIRLEIAASLKQSISKELAGLTARESVWNTFQKAVDKLKSAPEDPGANFAIGRWYAIEENNWASALKHLSKVKESKWKAAASLELEDPSDATKQQSVAEAWWELAATEKGETKTKLMLHAGEWYEKTLSNTTSPLKKQSLQNRLAEIAALKPGNVDQPVSSGKTPAALRGMTVQKPGEWVDLLAWTEGIDWKQRGGYDWNRNLESLPSRNGLSIKSGRFNRYPIAAILDGDYELEVEFTRQSGGQVVAVFFPVGIHNLQFEVGTNGGRQAFVAHVLNKWYGERTPCPVSENEKHRIVIHVHVDGEKAAFKIDWDDNKDYITWDGPLSALANRHEGWKLTMIRRPWIGTYESQITFHKIRARMLSGEIRRDVITDVDRAADLKNGLVRLIGEKANTPQVGWAQFHINQIPLESGTCEDERAWPLVTAEPSICQDFYGAHSDSRLKCPIPKSAKSFTVYGSNDASRTTAFSVFVDGKELYKSGVTDLAKIKLDLPPDSSLLELVVDGMGSNWHDHSYWCTPRYHTLPIDKLTDKMLEGKLSSTGLKFAIASGTVGAHKVTHNRPISTLTAVPLVAADQIPCDEFLFAPAPSTVSYAIPEGMSRFTAIGYNVRSQHVKYEVWADAKKIYESPQAGLIPIDVKLPKGTKTIELKVNDMGDGRDDLSMWCYPRLHKK
ncbi:MAG: hypothetical protein JWM11_4810 [Planctomycetaceae bacterium]|nr:hypothetical protein [Planctomycetaceae bacterium]